MNELRKIERLTNNEWETVKMKDIKKNDIFRMFEEDKQPIGEYEAYGNAYCDSKNIWGVSCVPTEISL